VKDGITVKAGVSQSCEKKYFQLAVPFLFGWVVFHHTKSPVRTCIPLRYASGTFDGMPRDPKPFGSKQLIQVKE